MKHVDPKTGVAANAEREALAASPTKNSSEADRAILEAYDWFVRLHSGSSTAEQLQRFKAWLEQNDQHREAYAEAEALWADSDLHAALGQLLPQPRRRSRQSRRLGISLGLAASLLLAIALGPKVILWQRADHWTSNTISDLRLADGSRIVLDAGSAIALDRDNPRHIELLQGEAYCEVKPDAAHPFVVDSRHSRTQVLGTHFAVRASAMDDTITVEEGLVKVTGKDSKVGQTLLHTDEQAISGNRRLEGPIAVSASQALDWSQGSLVFEQTPFDQVVERIQRYRQGWVIWASPTLRSLPVSGRYNLGDPDHILDTLDRTLPADIERVTPWLVVIR